MKQRVFDLDFDPAAPVRLLTFRWIYTIPVPDPHGIHGTEVIAPSAELALDYLVAAGGWRGRDRIVDVLRERYLAIGTTSAVTFAGTVSDWMRAVESGLSPCELVLFPEGAQTQNFLDSKTLQGMDVVAVGH